jgi:hypothetical protein
MEEGRRLSACFSPRCCLGANAFEINDIQEDEVEAALTRRSGCNHVALGRKGLDGVFKAQCFGEAFGYLDRVGTPPLPSRNIALVVASGHRPSTGGDFPVFLTA